MFSKSFCHPPYKWYYFEYLFVNGLMILCLLCLLKMDFEMPFKKMIYWLKKFDCLNKRLTHYLLVSEQNFCYLSTSMFWVKTAENISRWILWEHIYDISLGIISCLILTGFGLPVSNTLHIFCVANRTAVYKSFCKLFYFCQISILKRSQ